MDDLTQYEGLIILAVSIICISMLVIFGKILINSVKTLDKD